MARRRFGIRGRDTADDEQVLAAVAAPPPAGAEDFAAPEAAPAELPAAPPSSPEDWTVHGATPTLAPAPERAAAESWTAADGAGAAEPAAEIPEPFEPAAQQGPDVTGPEQPEPAPAEPPAPKRAEQAALDEILALERDLEDAKREAAETRVALDRRLRASEARATEAERARAESDERLAGLERLAVAAAERLETAEQRLKGEAERIASEAEQRIAVAAERARTQAAERAAARVHELEHALDAAEGKLAAERRAREDAEGSAREAEQRAAELAAEARRERERRLTEVEQTLGALGDRADRAGREAQELAAATDGASAHEEARPSIRAARSNGRRRRWALGRKHEAAQEIVTQAGEEDPNAEDGVVVTESAAGEDVADAPLAVPPAPVEGDTAERASDGEPNDPVRLNEASFDDLRALGMSITQAKRVLRHRESGGGFTSVDELDAVPGFPRLFLADLKDRLIP
jgi:DNA uptake protein ComE-like DNA-binding protein